MTDLRDRLDDLVAGVPAYVAGDAAKAWRTGRRRLWRRRVLAAAALVLVAAVTFTFLPARATLAPAESGTGVTSYPQRIGHQWWTPELPNRPGPMAGLLSTDVVTFFAVSPHGDLYRLPNAIPTDVFPSLSGDGRYLAYYENRDQRMNGLVDQGSFQIRDLVTGAGMAYSGSMVQEQSPGFWSPNNRRLAYWAGSDRLRDGPEVVYFTMGGDSGRVRPPVDGAQFAGWRDDETLVWVTTTTPLTVITTALDGAVRSQVALQPPLLGEGRLGQQTAAVVGDLLVYRVNVGAGADWHRYRLSDGVEVGPSTRSRADVLCPVMAVGGTPVEAVPDSNSHAVAVLAPFAQEPLVVVDLKLGAECVSLVPDALAGSPNSGLFGTSPAGLLWWWREILAGVVLLALAGLGVGVLRRRKWGGLAARRG